MSKRIICIPDTQTKPNINLDYLAWAGEYIAEKKPDVIVHLGDHADLPSLSLFDTGKKSFEGRTYQADILAAHNGMCYLTTPISREMVRIKENKKKQWRPRMVLTLGNHENRINRAIDSDRKLDGLISVDDLNYEDFGWEVIPFLQPIIIEGVVFCHYLCSGVMGRAVTTAAALINKKHQSCVVGHQQGRDVAYGYRADGRRITAIIAGSYYDHEESYLNYQTNNHWRGLIVLNEVNDGEFDEMFVSIDYLRSKYSR